MTTESVIDKQVGRLNHLHKQVTTATRFQRAGTVVAVSGLAITAQGPPAKIGELCIIRPQDVYAQVVGFRDKCTVLLPFGSLRGIEPGCRVIATGQPLRIGVGPQMLGRVVDCFGQPLLAV